MAEAFSDDGVVAALTYAGVPPELHLEFVAFQRKHGGRADAFGLNAVRWGVLRRAPEWLDAGRVEAEPDDTRPGVWHVHCAQAGRLYWCWRLRYAHYDDYFAGRPPLDWSPADA